MTSLLTTVVTVSIGQCHGAIGVPTMGGVAVQIRRGPHLHDLTAAEALAWASGTPSPGLAERGLQVEVEPAGLVAFARGHRLAPQLLGLGPSVAEPGWFGVGLAGLELLTLTKVAFDLWARAGAHPTMWALCQSYVDEHEVAEDDPVQVAAGLVATLPALISMTAAYVDLATPDTVG